MADFIKVRRELREEGVALGLTGQELILYVTSEWDKLEKSRAEDIIRADKARVEERDHAEKATEKLRLIEFEEAERARSAADKRKRKKEISLI